MWVWMTYVSSRLDTPWPFSCPLEWELGAKPCWTMKMRITLQVCGGASRATQGLMINISHGFSRQRHKPPCWSNGFSACSPVTAAKIYYCITNLECRQHSVATSSTWVGPPIVDWKQSRKRSICTEHSPSFLSIIASSNRWSMDLRSIYIVLTIMVIRRYL